MKFVHVVFSLSLFSPKKPLPPIRPSLCLSDPTSPLSRCPIRPLPPLPSPYFSVSKRGSRSLSRSSSRSKRSLTSRPRDGSEPALPTTSSDEFRPFVRRLPEVKIGEAAMTLVNKLK